MIKIPKISERSLYRKIQNFIEEASRGGFSDFESLINNITKNLPLQFTRYEKIKDRETKVVPCKHETIRRVAYLAAELGLIDISSGKLTIAGTQAIKRDYYDNVMKLQISKTLENHGISQNLLFDTIQSMLAAGQVQHMPSWDAICDRLLKEANENLSRNKFHIYLTLLSASGAIVYIQKRIFLPHQSK